MIKIVASIKSVITNDERFAVSIDPADVQLARDITSECSVRDHICFQVVIITYR